MGVLPSALPWLQHLLSHWGPPGVASQTLPPLRLPFQSLDEGDTMVDGSFPGYWCQPGHTGDLLRVLRWIPHALLSPNPCPFAFQQEAGSRSSSSSAGRERLISEPPLTQEKAGGPTVPSHLLGTPYSFGLPPSSVVQDSRFPPLK